MKIMPFTGFKFGTLVKSDILNTSLANRKMKKSLSLSQRSHVLNLPLKPPVPHED